MRYGVVRVSPNLPPPTVQRRLIESAGCDVLLDERQPTPASQRILFQFLLSLKTGDEVMVHAPAAFEATTGELARLLRYFFESGVTLRITGGSRAESFAPQGPIPRALSLLADYEASRSIEEPTRRRVRLKNAPLTQHQLKFARDLHRRSHSMRSIGLLFQLAPNEMAELIRGRPSSAESGK